MTIQSFACSDTETLFKKGVCPRKWEGIDRVAPRKLDMLDAAAALSDLKAPPSNKLERLKRDRKGQWAIRINDQWRICFRWGAQGPEGVEIVDYH
jgi:proteic killer suppression protein